MGKKTLAETIREITRNHLENNDGILLGQCITAVGWVDGTVPDCRGIIDLPMTDVAGAGFAVGAAMVGIRPIFIIRFQDFMMLNGSPIVNYAAKCKDLHGKTAPVFVRAIASEGLGPVHSGVLHAIFMHFPGCKVYSPMTPDEYSSVWEDYMNGDDPAFVSEHRMGFKKSEEMPDIINENADITIFAVSSPRFHLQTVAEKLKADKITSNIIHLYKLKPLQMKPEYISALQTSKCGLVVDSGFETCGASRSIAYELAEASGCHVRALGLLDKTKCLCPPYRNEAPDADKIYEAAIETLKKKKI